MARIVIRRSQVTDQSADAPSAASPWSGTIAADGASSLAVAAAVVCRATQEGEAGGADAANQRQFTRRYTVSGLLLNVVACGFWALVFQVWPNQKRPSFIRSAGRSIGISILACMTDYSPPFHAWL